MQLAEGDRPPGGGGALRCKTCTMLVYRYECDPLNLGKPVRNIPTKHGKKYEFTPLILRNAGRFYLYVSLLYTEKHVFYVNIYQCNVSYDKKHKKLKNTYLWLQHNMLYSNTWGIWSAIKHPLFPTREELPVWPPKPGRISKFTPFF